MSIYPLQAELNSQSQRSEEGIEQVAKNSEVDSDPEIIAILISKSFIIKEAFLGKTFFKTF